MYFHFSSFFQTLREIFGKPDVKNLDESEKVEMATAFDTMWATMLALKEASVELPSSSPLEHNVKEKFGNKDITKTLGLKLRNVSFEGLTVIAFYLFLYFPDSLSCFSHLGRDATSSILPVQH